jgi:hypothetical protein
MPLPVVSADRAQVVKKATEPMQGAVPDCNKMHVAVSTSSC